MYSILLEYPSGKDTMYCDMLTHAANVELLLHVIHASQNTHNTLILHDTHDLTLALVILSSSTHYTAKIASK
jgi:hypothetical protein